MMEAEKDIMMVKITKEEYYKMMKLFYSKYAKTYKNPKFHKYFLNTMADACIVYIDEFGLAPSQKDELFRRSLRKTYVSLQKF